MFLERLTGNREKRLFGELEKKKIGSYVYALKDPRDGKIFYVGQGIGNRIFDHFKEAESAIRNHSPLSSKILRILDIWMNEEDVDWVLIAHGLDPSNINAVESAVIDALSVSQNGQCLNIVRGPHSSLITADGIAEVAAQPVNVKQLMKKIFIFPIQNGLLEGKDEYSATRSTWYVKSEYQSGLSYAVGIRNGVSVGSYKINSWKPDGKKHAFDGSEYPLLKHLNWSKIISYALGFWQRGGYLIVEFDGNGKFRLIRGGGRDARWVDMV